MSPRTLYILSFLLFASLFAWSDNEAGGSDMPWDEDPPTAVDNVASDSIAQRPTIYYDLQGRRVANPQPGTIYIVNGKKIIKR